MSTGSIAVIVVAVVAVIVCIGWFVFGRRHPESAATHTSPDRTTMSGELDGGVDRPAGPDAELMAPEDLGGDLDEPRAN